MSFRERVRLSHQALGIPEDYEEVRGLPLFPEPDELVDTEPDYQQRKRQLTPAALSAWQSLKQAAHAEGHILFLVSAFRSLQYQHDLIANKLAKGIPIEKILQVNAAPGYSEHHSGNAIDIGSPGCEVLQDSFEKTDEFQWLMDNAFRFGFVLSYPRNNPYGIDYEPWHWCFKGHVGA